MYLKNLKLSDFRSYEYLDLDLKEGINVIKGKNAQGKTNIIEAVYYFSTLKSHRFVLDRELIKEKKEKSVMRVEFFKKRDTSLKIVLNKNKKREIYKNEIKTDRSEFFGNFYSVLFSPEDINLIKGEKEERRKFVDTDILQLRPNYYNILKKYNSVLINRNKVLKEYNYSHDDSLLMEVYTKNLIKWGSEVTLYRSLYIERLKETAKKIYKEISNDERELEIKYKTSFEIKDCENKKEILKSFEEELKKKSDEELLKRSTAIGPHRDDIEFLLDNKNAKIYASQGQQRTIILPLKLSELMFLKEITNEAPILLLDDILSERDKVRQEKLFYYIKDYQTILTDTDAQEIKQKNYNMIEIENSKIINK